MAIFLTAASRVIVQGMTGTEGMKHTTRMLAGGTTVVGGVNPRKAGTSTRHPARAKPGATADQLRMLSGQPCSSSTVRLPSGFHSW